MRRKNLTISLEDWKTLLKVSPSIATQMKKYFFVDIEKIKKHGFCVVTLTYRYYATHPYVRRGFYSLIHSLHVVACDLYRKGDFSEYLVLDGFMFMLIKML